MERLKEVTGRSNGRFVTFYGNSEELVYWILDVVYSLTFCVIFCKRCMDGLLCKVYEGKALFVHLNSIALAQIFNLRLLVWPSGITFGLTVSGLAKLIWED